MATASLVLSLIGLFCGIGAILGIILGFVAKSQIKRTGEGGSGLATAGIVIGFVTLALSILLGIWVTTTGSFS
jgi:hypothetical protein